MSRKQIKQKRHVAPRRVRKTARKHVARWRSPNYKQFSQIDELIAQRVRPKPPRNDPGFCVLFALAIAKWHGNPASPPNHIGNVRSRAWGNSTNIASCVDMIRAVRNNVKRHVAHPLPQEIGRTASTQHPQMNLVRCTYSDRGSLTVTGRTPLNCARPNCRRNVVQKSHPHCHKSKSTTRSPTTMAPTMVGQMESLGQTCWF